MKENIITYYQVGILATFCFTSTRKFYLAFEKNLHLTLRGSQNFLSFFDTTLKYLQSDHSQGSARTSTLLRRFSIHSDTTLPHLADILGLITLQAQCVYFKCQASLPEAEYVYVIDDICLPCLAAIIGR